MDNQALRATSSLLVPVAPDVSRLPLFCLFGTELYRPLAEALGPEVPVYGVIHAGSLALRKPRGRRSRPLRAEELADLYLPEVRRVQPRGPYQLAAFCYGARVAVELAHRLLAAGETIQVLATFDSYMPGAVRRQTWRWLWWHGREVLRRGPGYVLAGWRNEPVGPVRDALLAQSGAMADPARTFRQAQQFREYSKVHYRPRPYPGRVVVFRAADNVRYHPPAHVVDPLLGWRDIARGGLDVHDIPTTHLRIMSGESVVSVATVLRTYLGT